MSAEVSMPNIHQAGVLLSCARQSLNIAMEGINQAADILHNEAKWADETTEDGSTIVATAKAAEAFRREFMKALVEFPDVAPILYYARKFQKPTAQRTNNVVAFDAHASKASEANLSKAVK